MLIAKMKNQFFFCTFCVMPQPIKSRNHHKYRAHRIPGFHNNLFRMILCIAWAAISQPLVCPFLNHRQKNPVRKSSANGSCVKRIIGKTAVITTIKSIGIIRIERFIVCITKNEVRIRDIITAKSHHISQIIFQRSFCRFKSVAGAGNELGLYQRPKMMCRTFQILIEPCDSLRKRLNQMNIRQLKVVKL